MEDTPRSRRKRRRQSQRVPVGRWLKPLAGGVALVILLWIILQWVFTPRIHSAAEQNWPAHQGTSIGSPDAPVKLLVFSDFDCPDCQGFHQFFLSTLLDEYIRPGKVYYSQIPILTDNPDSLLAANAAYCSSKQEGFWDFSELLYANPQPTFDQLVRMASVVKIDHYAFEDCMNKGLVLTYVHEGTDNAAKRQISQDPGFVINGVTVTVKDMPDLQQKIDEALLARTTGGAD